MSFWTVPRSSVRATPGVRRRRCIRRTTAAGALMVIEVFMTKRDALEKRFHVAQMADGNAHLPDLAARQHMVGVVTGLGRQVESDG